MKTWTPEEVEILTANYNSVSNERLYELIPAKSPLAIYKKAYKMGLRKSAEIEFLNRSKSKKGEKASNWKGGTKTTRAGYRQVLCPEHPRADSCGYVMEHILIWEQATIGVPLKWLPKMCTSVTASVKNPAAAIMAAILPRHFLNIPQPRLLILQCWMTMMHNFPFRR